MVSKENNNCFFISPLGNDSSKKREEIDGLIDTISPIVKEFNLELIAPHRITKPGSITKQVIEHLMNDRLVIANLKELNPNVMYELAVRHAVRLPVVTLYEKGTNLPFDIAPERSIPFTNDIPGHHRLKKALPDFIDEALNDQLPDNPIFRHITEKSILPTDSPDNPVKYMVSRLDSIPSLISNLSRKQEEILEDLRIKKVGRDYLPKRVNFTLFLPDEVGTTFSKKKKFQDFEEIINVTENKAINITPVNDEELKIDLEIPNYIFQKIFPILKGHFNTSRFRTYQVE